MHDHWETDIAELLTELSSVQGALLALLTEKRQILASGDQEALASFPAREQQLIERLTACHERRQQLLARAAEGGLPSDSIRALSSVLPSERRAEVDAGISQAAQRGRFLQHQCLTNWVLVQRWLLHLSQMIEIIATGGQPVPTYGNGADRAGSGALVDQAV